MAWYKPWTWFKKEEPRGLSVYKRDTARRGRDVRISAQQQRMDIRTRPVASIARGRAVQVNLGRLINHGDSLKRTLASVKIRVESRGRSAGKAGHFAWLNYLRSEAFLPTRRYAKAVVQVAMNSHLNHLVSEANNVVSLIEVYDRELGDHVHKNRGHVEPLRRLASKRLRDLIADVQILVKEIQRESARTQRAA